MTTSKRGPLYPDRLTVGFTRMAPDAETAQLVRWWWLNRWELAEGETSDQHILAFAASNLTVEPERAGLSGPTTRATVHTLRGNGWVVGALLQPAGLTAFTGSPAEVRDSYLLLDDDALVNDTAAAVESGGVGGGVGVVKQWLLERARVTEEALLANRMSALVEETAAIATVDQLARALAVSTRTVHRLAARYVGVTPYAMIRRRRLQEAAELIRAGRGLADVAADCGFTDQAHFAREFKTAIGMPPGEYRGSL